uniref:KASH domain-containing protein n=1 Tax=Strigamia maritima TaxID=126957 RepID=T1IPR3_STRMM
MDGQTDPSLPSFANSSPVLASLANKSKGQETGLNTSSDTERQHVLMTSFTKAMKRRSPCKQDEFWEALKSNYNYLMDEGLIKSCKEANGELAPVNDVSTTVWTFSEYMEHYKMLCEWLERLRNKVWSVEDTSAPDKTSKEMHAEELGKLNVLRKLFIEQSQRLFHRYPNLNDEITLQVAHINTCWDELEKAINMDKPKLDAKLLLKDISYEIRCLRKWLQEIQVKLKLPALYPGCTIEDLEKKYKEYQVLQKDIESHQKNVLSVLKLCDQLQRDDQVSTLVRDAAHVQTVAHNLQRRWHATWLKSLECHFVIEELITKFREGVFPGKLLESSIDDEPLKKYPRLSGEWSGNPLLTSQQPEKNGACFSPNCTFLDDDTDCDGLMSDEMEDEFYSAIDGPLNMNMSLDIKTRDVGTGNDGYELTKTNDKGVMVGTTGITELKAGHEGSFEPFEIIQDIGYSSESSTQLSNEERNGESIQIYSYEKRNSVDDVEMKSEIKEEPEGVKEQMDENGIVMRPGPNCATYYFRHVDTDPECKFEDQDEFNSHLTHSSTPLKRKSRDSTHLIEQERSLTRWSDVGSVDSSFELDSTVSRIDWSEDDFREKQQINGEKFSEEHKQCQNSIHALVEEADRLVRKESLTELLGPRHNLEPLKLGEAQTKANRLKEWLRKQHPTCPIPPVLPPTTVLDSSCDASGECTSNDSEDEHSDTSEDLNNSVILCHKRKGSLDGTMDINDGNGKVIMRNKKRTNGSRPWSVTELYQLTNRLDLSPFSISESALNVLLTPTTLESNCFDNSSPSIITEKDVCTPSSESINLISARKTKSAKVRRRHIRRSDSGSDNHSLTQGSANGSDGCNQKTLIHHHVRRHSRGSKSHSSSSGGGKSAGQSSGTEQYSSEANKGVKQADVSDSESEPTMVEKIHKLGRQQNEELSSLSEQAWDDYQEAPYLSEPYSENQIDEDLIKRLVNFGDDYSAFIESQSDSISVGSYKGLRNLRISGRFSRKQTLNSSDNMEEDSDSDVDDLNHIIEDSCNQLQWLETRIRKHAIKDVRGKRHNSLSSTSDYIELFATCQTNINCLQVIAGHLQAKPHCTTVSEADVQKVKDTILRWEKLRCLMQEQQSEHKMGDVQQQMTDFEESMSNIDNSITGCDNKIDDKTILERMIQEFQAYLSMLQEKKATLLTINVQVHSFMVSPGSPDPTLSKLKEEVAALYHRWDEIFEKGNVRLSSLNTLKNTWLEYETELEELKSGLSKDKETSLIPTTDHVALQPHLLLPATCSDASNEVELSSLIRDSPMRTLQVPESAGLNGVSSPLLSGFNPETLAKRQAQLTQLQDFAHRMEDMLANTKAWDSISQQLNSTAAELQQLQPRGGRRKSSFLLPNSPRSDVPKRVRFSIAPDMDKPDSGGNKGGNKRHSFLWRVIRAAVPIQLAIIVVLCVAYLLGPDCCDSRNNFVFSFSPHLRYVNGPPPV